ncbi:PQQ-binding-like beta-propeller repeat protein [Sphingomonas alba]|uniref:PQQ-binding-like beta-propeller repeat protein n=1 Tax=Sphingomonas alba TaxID=2908208 RepID=A0ABT0RLG2_9SPHN|nr:PQQ-binding-like beta-propeller repeat protein [Sphingomonas alba]MCL6683370.1 PQQ-binding-like beta-propeller repeat protein [Sphingomonas alba]
MKRSVYKIGMVFAAAALLGGCNPFKKDKPKTPVVGERISVLASESDVEIDDETAAMPFTLPEAVANEDWTQPGGNAQKSMGHLALGNSLGTAWTVSIGEGSSNKSRLVSSPVVGGGRVYTIDAIGTVRAFDVRNGGQVWSSSFGKDISRESNYGGGVAYDNGRVYATNGNGFVAALDATNGGVVWTVKPGGPLRGAPTATSDSVYVMSQDNQLYALKESDGTTNWSSAAALEIAGIFGAASPSVVSGTVVAGFSSGELNAYRYENGRQVWSDTLSRTSISTSVAALSDIDADPVVDGGQVFSIGKGGRMVALELTSGQRMWELNIAGNATPWVAGDWVFVVTDEAKAIALNRTNGKVRWINQLPRWENEKGKKNPIFYYGPVLAGGRLVLVSSRGALININPENGAFLTQSQVGAGISLQPVVAGSTLFVLDDRGRLTAFR